MGTRGYVAYRYKRKYYRQFIPGDAYPTGYGYGQRLLEMVPRNPSAFKDWVANRIHMLENAKITEIINDDEYLDVVYPEDGIGADELGFGTTYDNYWSFAVGLIEWTYVFDLDNMAFTVNGAVHFRLDNLPPTLDYYDEDELRIPIRYLCDTVDLWPIPDFDTDERQQQYDALQSIVVPASEWGTPTRNELSPSERFSIKITDHMLRKTAYIFLDAYMPNVQREVRRYYWDVLCASVPALPFFQASDFKGLGLSPHTLSSGFDDECTRPPYRGKPPLPRKSPAKMTEEEYIAEFHRQRKLSIAYHRQKHPRPEEDEPIEYFWVRGCLVTICLRLGEQIYVAHEVEKMVQKMRLDGSVESTGIILSSQQELVVVAVDGPQVRHTPVLDISVVGERSGGASEGRLLLTRLLRPPLVAPPLPWRTIQPRQSSPTSSGSIADLPPEVLRVIVDSVDMGTYLALRRVSRSFYLVCIERPRIGPYTVLREVPGFETTFTARSWKDDTLKTIQLRWKRVTHNGFFEHEKWELREVSPGLGGK